MTPLPPTSPEPTPLPTGHPHPAPAGLQADETYRVTLAITTAKGGLDRIDPLERLTVLPSNSDQLLVELGVLKGGNRVLFAVQPGTVVHGPGKCTPGAIDCEVLSLGANQVESVSVQTPTGESPSRSVRRDVNRDRQARLAFRGRQGSAPGFRNRQPAP